MACRVDKLVMPPEKHVPIPKEELLFALRARLDQPARARFDELVKLMEGVASFDFLDLKERMRSNFLPFASGARNQTYLQRASKGLPTTPALDQKELEFVGDTFDVLRASHYHLLTENEWQIALAESFKLTLPMEVEWDYMDEKLMKRFWDSTPRRQQLRRHLPDEVADRILVFHRGIGTTRLKGLLIEEKLDLLCEYTALRVLRPLTSLLPLRVRALIGLPAAPIGGDPKKAAGGAGGRSLRASATLAKQFSTLKGRVSEGSYIASDHKYAKVVERVTLKRLCPGVLSLLWKFLWTVELQEPTFKSIVVVYRRAYPPRKPPAYGSDAPNRTKEERMRGILNHRNIHVKVFGETPMADVEMIFPSKKVFVKPFQLVNLAVTVVTALVTGALMLLRSGEAVNMTLLWTAASLVLTRCFQVYSQANAQRAQLQQDMSSQLYDKMQDSQEGVVGVIMEEMADQQFKQMVLAYMLLLNDGPLLVDDLDARCEDMLVNDFGTAIDFQVEDALPRLERWGLVTRDQEDTVTAVSMEEAIETLTAAWTLAYRALGGCRGGFNGGDEIATADLLSGRASTFGAGLEAFWAAGAGAAAAAAAAAAAEAEGRGRGLFSRGSKSIRLAGGSSSATPAPSGGAAGSDGSGAAGDASSGAADSGDGRSLQKRGSLFHRISKAARDLVD